MQFTVKPLESTVMTLHSEELTSRHVSINIRARSRRQYRFLDEYVEALVLTKYHENSRN